MLGWVYQRIKLSNRYKSCFRHAFTVYRFVLQHMQCNVRVQAPNSPHSLVFSPHQYPNCSINIMFSYIGCSFFCWPRTMKRGERRRDVVKSEWFFYKTLRAHSNLKKGGCSSANTPAAKEPTCLCTDRTIPLNEGCFVRTECQLPQIFVHFSAALWICSPITIFGVCILMTACMRGVAPQGELGWSRSLPHTFACSAKRIFSHCYWDGRPVVCQTFAFQRSGQLWMRPEL